VRVAGGGLPVFSNTKPIKPVFLTTPTHPPNRPPSFPVQVARRHLAAGGRYEWPAVVQLLAPELVTLVEAAWDPLPEKRPTAPQLMQGLLRCSLQLGARARRA
jgi:hypothetical protein